MAEAVVSFAIERISDLLFHEAVYLGGVCEDAELLRDELMRMRRFLEDADHKQEKDERLRTQVAEIRDLAYGVEDVIDSFILKVANQAGGCQGIIKRFTSIFTKFSHLHKIGVEIKAIQSRLEYIFRTLPTFEISFQPDESSSSFSALQLLRRTYWHVEEDDVVSLEGITQNVLARLMTEDEEDRPHHVVSIVGMGGIGKTTLAKKVYNHPDVRFHFNFSAWAFISQQCRPREVFHDLLIKVLSPSKEDRKLIDKLTENELIKELFDALKERRYLVVLDDLWKIVDWNVLKPAFPRGKKGSKILITTRNKEVALFADPCNSPVELRLLTYEEGWKLFSMKAFRRDNIESHTDSEEFEILGREMVKKCGGSPQAIVALGGLLATKRSLAQWEIVLRNIHAYLNLVQQEHGEVNGIFVLSYNDLPYYLKPCLLYLGHYPEDSEIPKKELIRLWIAEGFISQSLLESVGMLMEDVAEQFLEELINRSLVQVGKRDCTGTNVKTCRIHDLLRDLCIKKAQEENFFRIMPPSTEENNDNFVNVTLTACLPRRIAIHSGKRYVHLEGECPYLRSLLFSLSEEFIECKNFKFLRVLKFEMKNMDIWNVSSEIGSLLHLRYLHLISHGAIIMPRSIGQLKSLYTLKVECDGLTIPLKVLFKLECIRHILLFEVGALFFAGKLVCSSPRFTSRNIETLKYIDVVNFDEKHAMLSLKNIRSLGIRFERSKDVETFLKVVIQFHRLRSLKMSLLWGLIQSYPDLELLSHCHLLSKLLLEGKIKEDLHSGQHHVLKFLPANITKLTLRESKLKQDPMVVLEKLPHLRVLCLRYYAYKGTKLICSANGFLRLDSLELVDLFELEEWDIEEGAMPSLRSLYLCAIPKLKEFPQGLRYITTLKEMKLKLMMRSLIERIQVIDSREGDDFSKVTHIPSRPIVDTLEF